MRRRSPPSPTATRCCAVRRGYLLRAGIEERPVLDWPHLARRVQVAKTTAKGLRALTEREYRARPAIRRLLDSLHWRLWNGQTDRARDALAQIERRLQAFDADRARSGRRSEEHTSELQSLMRNSYA